MSFGNTGIVSSKSFDVNNPYPTDGDSIYKKDLDLANCSIGTFTGSIASTFDDYHVEIIDTTATNPKTFTLHFERPITSSKFGIGSVTGDFSNVKLEFKDVAGTILDTVDESANSDKLPSEVYQFNNITFIEVVVSFYTADPVKIGGAFIPKILSRSIASIEGVLSTKNSTSAVLANGAVFTGSAESVLNHGIIIISVYADQSSATDGLSIQQSTDGTNWDHVDTYTIAAGTGKTFSIQPAAVFMRVVYTNGGVTQTAFRLQTQLKPVYVKPSSHRMADAISNQDDAELVKAGITGERDDGVFGNCKLDNGNNLRVNSFPYTYSIAEGEISGHDPLLKFGTRTTVAAGTPSTIWEGPTALYAYMSTAQQLKVSSTDNVNDNVGGTGALTLTIQGLDASWAEISETITMTGTTAVTTTASFIRVYRAFVATCGTSYSNTGTISILNNASTVTQAIINIGDSQTLMTLWTVPAGKVAYLTHGTFSTSSNKGATISLFTRLNDGGTLYPWQIKYRAYTFSGNENFPFEIPFPIVAKTDIEVQVNTPVAAGATSCGSTFELWYEDV